MTENPPNLAHRLWRSPAFHRWALPVLIFIIALLPRAIEPIGRTNVWFRRSYDFIGAVQNHDWATTFQRYHPGVSVMWLSGAGLEVYQTISGRIPHDQFFSLTPPLPGASPKSTIAGAIPLTAALNWLAGDISPAQSALTAGVIPLAAAISLCIALTYPLLSRLSGRSIALIGGLLLALDPFQIAYSKVIHVDALLAMLMILSALFLLVYIRGKKARDLIFSGIFAGFAMLTKSPSIFLIPYALLVVGVSYLWEMLQQPANERGRFILRQIWPAARTLLVWALLAAVTFVVLFPAMWRIPGTVLSEIFASLVVHASSAHKNLVFFAGQLWEGDPGIAFHLAVLLWKTTALTLPLIILAVFWAFKRIKSPESRTLWALLAYAFFFTLQMGLADKKQVAYILPTFPALSLIAAYGLVWSVEALGRWRAWPPGSWRQVTILALAIVMQAGLVLRHHPYYGAHHNLLAGGSTAAARVLPLQDQGEGMDQAARYLSQLPYGQEKRAAVFRRNDNVFRRFFAGHSTTEMDPLADYRVYDLNSVLRDFQGEATWQKAWLNDQAQDPLYTVVLDGVTYVWVYGELPEDPTGGGPRMALDNRLGEGIRLTEARVNSRELPPGDTLIVALLWQVDGLIDENYTVFTHLISPKGELVVQQDNIPLHGARPTFTWNVGETLYDVYSIELPADLAPGEYELSAGMYDPESIVRLAAYDGEGNRLPNDRISLGSIRVRPEQPEGS